MESETVHLPGRAVATSEPPNQENLDLFWRFVYERQAIWYRRFVLKQPAPWTTDPILRNYKFTNVYRELDKGTVFYLEHVVNKSQSKTDYIFKTLVYRVFNHIPTWEALEFAGVVNMYPTRTWDHDLAWACIQAIQQSGDGHVFTNAHVVSPYNSAPGNSKAEKVTYICSAWAKNIDKIYNSIMAQPNLEALFKFLKGMYGLGPFLAYEVCIDLMYGNIVPFTEDDWANAGPGAMRGANLIFPGSRKYLAIMRYLRDTQEAHFERLGLDWDTVSYSRRPLLSLRGIEHSLCEFQKYERGHRGSGRPRNNFKPTSQGDEAWMTALKG